MPQEIERKFLVDGEYKSKAYASSRIVQGYICSARGRTVRIRIRDDKGYLTIKGPADASGISRYEWEKEIPLDEARDLMKSANRVPSTRRATWCGAAGTCSKWTNSMAKTKGWSLPRSNCPRPTNPSKSPISSGRK